MKIFISWSGERSKDVASALKQWLPHVMQSIEPWMSERDINAGARWGANLDEELASSNFGVLCLTRENLEKPWLLFEAGSLAKAIDIARVVPYRLDMSATDVRPPLSQFQGVDATKNGTFRLLKSINEASRESLSPERLERLFEKMWPDFETELHRVKESQVGGTVAQRDAIDYLKEVLEIVRQTKSTQPPTVTPKIVLDEERVLDQL